MSTDEKVQVSVIFATYNRADIISDVLKAWELVNQKTKYSYEIICSDDESSDNTVSIIKAKQGLPIKILENEHGGASKARNAALKIVKGEIIIFTGDDIFPYPDYVNDHYENYIKYGPKVATLGKIEWHNNIKVNHLMNHITNVGCEQFGFAGLLPYQLTDFRHFYTSNISIARSELEELGEKFSLTFDKYGFEDIELGFRLSKNGVRILYDPNILVYHYHEYHSVDKFCNRQLSAGDQLVVFEQLHSDLSKHTGFENNDVFTQVVTNYIKNNKNYSLKGKLNQLFISWMKQKTVNLEKKIDNQDSMIKRGLCSLLYSEIFRYHMYLGWAKRINKDIQVDETQMTESIIRFMNSDYAQLFWDSGNDFNEVESLRVNVVGNDFRYRFHVKDCRRIRFDPLNKKCIVKHLKVYGLDEKGNKFKLVPAWMNAGKVEQDTLSFMNTEDSQIIYEIFGDKIKEVEIRGTINGHKKVPYWIWILARYARNMFRKRDLTTKVLQPYKIQILLPDNMEINYEKLINQPGIRYTTLSERINGFCDYVLLLSSDEVSEEKICEGATIIQDKYYDYVKYENFVIVRELIAVDWEGFKEKRKHLKGYDMN